MTGISSLFPYTSPLLPAVLQARAAVKENSESLHDADKPSPHGKKENYGTIVCSDVNRDNRDEILHQNLKQGAVIPP